MAAITINRFAKDLATFSRKSHLVVLCLVVVPILIGVAWIVFPFLEARNLGFRAWHFSCYLGFMVAGFGIVCWLAEKLYGGSSPSWFAVLILAGLGLGVVALRFYGAFYWAFDRGYFLN